MSKEVLNAFVTQDVFTLQWVYQYVTYCELRIICTTSCQETGSPYDLQKPFEQNAIQ